MSDGGSESISGVIGLGDEVEVEMLFDHFLNLFFLGVAIAGESLFDLVRVVLENRKIMLASDKKNNAKSLGDRNAGCNVLDKEKFFYRHDVGLVLFDDFVDGIVDVEKPVAERRVGRGGDNAAIEHLRMAAIESVDGGRGL